MTDNVPTPYADTGSSRHHDPDELRARIPGWGVDRNRADRPAVPREFAEPQDTGAHWELPERQSGSSGREKSTEHAFVTPVFGTVAPLHGVSGTVRRFAYRFSEGRAAHWLLLIAGDRIDSGGAHLRSLATARPDNPFTETGVVSELGPHGARTRFGQGRADMHHQWIDPLIVGAPWIAGTLITAFIATRVFRRAR
jgi:hypothetical protein